MNSYTKSNSKWAHKWGYSDTEFLINDDLSVEVTGNRYNICGYKMHDFIPFLQHCVGVTIKKEDCLQELPQKYITAANINLAFYNELKQIFSQDHYSNEDEMRLSHSHGQTSVDEIFNVLYNKLDKFVDLVFFPHHESDVEKIIALALKHNVCLIPYGGGSNVSNALKLPANENRMIVSVDMQYMNQVELIDTENLRAYVQAGIRGTDLEEALAKINFISGHQPDSVEFSTLGGWIATNASGMKKNKYGNIEDIVESFTLITPTGKVEMQSAFPRLSMGMNPMKMLIGNEGNLGIITKAVLKIRPKPESRRYQAILFPELANGIEFIKELNQKLPLPASIRLMDNIQFKWGHALNPKPNALQKFMKSLEKGILKLKKIDFDKLAVATLLLEGDAKEIKRHEQQLLDLAKKHKGLKAGAKNGERGYNLTFAIAYIRELLNKVNILGETFETTVPWSRIQKVYDAVIKNAYEKHKEFNLPGKPLICGRITQIYHSAVCMYFTYAIHIKGIDEPEKVFAQIEHSFRDIILDNGGSVSHHHGIGKLRKDFMPEVLSQESIKFLWDAKKSLDPQNIFGIKNNVFALEIND